MKVSSILAIYLYLRQLKKSPMSLESVSQLVAAQAAQARRDEFNQWVRSALNHLYDVPYLQSHPLAALVTTTQRDRSQQLREVLLNAIDAMRPLSPAQQGSSAWRAFRILELRYIEGLSPADTMTELAISRSQFFKEQARMVDAIVDLLWQKYGAASPPNADATAADGPRSRREAALTEMERLRGQSKSQTVDLGEVLLNLRPLLESLAEVKHIEIRYSLRHELMAERADRVMARQAILGALTYALDLVPYGQVDLSSLHTETGIGVLVMARAASPGSTAPTAPVREGVTMSQQGHWHAQLLWQPADSVTVFVVDDNEGFISLISRYLAGSRCRVVGATTVALAKQFLLTNTVDVIVSDVMMPDEDGWEFLAYVKSTPHTAGVPFVVCSVLREPQLAMALGADAYLAKPLTPEALHATLARWIEAAPSPARGHPG
ncbi:MAG: response regulator [Caldilinea sp.]|nr:response regulator [Caldilinea sp.]